MLHDLTADIERVREQAALHKRTAMRNNPPSLDAIRQADYIVWVKGTDGRMLASSKGYEQLTGIPSVEYEGRTDYSVWGEDGIRFAQDDEYVRKTGYTLMDVRQAWFNPKAQMHQTGLITITPYPLGVEVGTMGRCPRDSLEFVTEERYREIINGG